jgi:hypothetical protein
MPFLTNAQVRRSRLPQGGQQAAQLPSPPIELTLEEQLGKQRQIIGPYKGQVPPFADKFKKINPSTYTTG